MHEELAKKLKYLRLGELLSHWDDYLKMAATKRSSHARLLTHIIEQEYQVKQANACARRLKRAHIPDPFEIETFPFQTAHEDLLALAVPHRRHRRLHPVVPWRYPYD